MEQEQIQLGKLTKVELRKAWISEDGHFTPWLAEAENLKLLGQTIGIELELEAKEKNVGPFYADILCKDTISDNWVLIENQLERTDHKHLGQLITYAAGLKAATIVWIANPFTEEHRAALDWLNDITDEHFNFFGLEIELWQIGNSPFAPKFNIICQPNNWSKKVTAGASAVKAENLTETKLFQQRYWAVFAAYAKAKKSSIVPTKPLPQHWMNIALGRVGFKLTAIASFWDNEAWNSSNHEIRAEIEIYDTNYSKEYFSLLEKQKKEIESELGYVLNWYNPKDYKVCRIYVRKVANLRDEQDWPSQHNWLLQKLIELHAVFNKRVKELKIVPLNVVNVV